MSAGPNEAGARTTRDALQATDTLPALTAGAAARWPERTGFIFDPSGVRLTFAEIERRSNAIAHALAGLGIGLGDTVGVMLRNVAAFPLTWLALQKAGATMVPLNVFYKRDDAAYLLAHSEARAVVTADEFVPLLAEIAATGGPAPQLISVDGDGGGRAQALSVLAHDESPSEVPPDPKRLANIQYTSGTTGRPKGCMLSNRYWTAMARKLVGFGGLTQDDVMLTAQPFYYMDPQWNVACALTAGCPLVVLDRFHPTSLWEKVRAHNVTWFYCLGTMPLMMLNTPRQPSDADNNVRMVMCSAIPPGRHAEIEARWGAPWYEAFGMTETGGDLAVSVDEHDELVGTGSIGRPMADREARVVDADDNEVPAGTVGEMLLRGPDMMEGYFKNAEATAEIFRGGWLHTGDLVKQDAAGRFIYVGRKKEMIRRSSENISAAEVEETVASHPAVRLAACVPVPDEIRGEEVKAYVVLREGAAAEPAELNAHCAERLAYFKVPRYWTFVDDLPRTPSERIAKHVLVGGVDDLRAGAWDRVDGVWR
jgi:crotonobetaine/carnitine-CoA ligase